jgi:hypothetical protein
LTWKAIEQESLRRPGPAGLAPGALARLMLELRARMAVAGMAHRPSIFKAERASQREALTQNRAELVKLTDEMSLLVGSFLTPALWDRLAPRLAPSVDAFTALVYRDIPAPPPAERPLPVRRPDAPVPVRPLIRTLRLRVPGATPDEVRALRDRLVQRLQVQPYAVAPVTWGR